jgi:hypothetical protein
MIHRYVRDNGHELIIHLNFIVKCVYYMGLRFNFCFVASVALIDSHCRTNIISGVGHLRSNSVLPLVLCTVVHNIQGTGIILIVAQDIVNPT